MGGFFNKVLGNANFKTGQGTKGFRQSPLELARQKFNEKPGGELPPEPVDLLKEKRRANLVKARLARKKKREECLRST